MKKLKFIIYISLLPLLLTNVYAKEISKVVLFSLQTKNCSPAIGKKVTASVKDSIEQQKETGKSNSIRFFGSISPMTGLSPEYKLKKFIKIGKDLGADLVAFGRVNGAGTIAGVKQKKSNYQIEIIIKDISYGKAEAIFRSDWVPESMLKKASQSIAQQILEYSQSYHKIKIEKIKTELASKEKPRPEVKPQKKQKKKYYFDKINIAAMPVYTIPQGAFADKVNNGYGLEINSNFENYFLNRLVMKPAMSYTYFGGKHNSIDNISLLSFKAAAGYLFDFNFIKIIPNAGIGFQVNIMNYDKNGRDLYGNYSYSKDYFYDPLISAGIDFRYDYDNYYFYLSPSYTRFFESSANGEYFQIGLGAGMNL